MKDAIVTLNGRSGILASHLNFGDPRRGWDFRSLGRGGINFEEIIRALNAAGYHGPLSVEWEDSGMDREHGAKEALRVRPQARLRAQPRGLRRRVRQGGTGVTKGEGGGRKGEENAASRKADERHSMLAASGRISARLASVVHYREQENEAIQLCHGCVSRGTRGNVAATMKHDAPPSMPRNIVRMAVVFLAAGLGMGLTGPSALAAGTGTEDLSREAKELRAKYVGDLEKLAAWCEQEGLAAEAKQTRAALGPHDPY